MNNPALIPISEDKLLSEDEIEMTKDRDSPQMKDGHTYYQFFSKLHFVNDQRTPLIKVVIEKNGVLLSKYKDLAEYNTSNGTGQDQMSQKYYPHEKINHNEENQIPVFDDMAAIERVSELLKELVSSKRTSQQEYGIEEDQNELMSLLQARDDTSLEVRAEDPLPFPTESHFSTEHAIARLECLVGQLASKFSYA